MERCVRGPASRKRAMCVKEDRKLVLVFCRLEEKAAEKRLVKVKGEISIILLLFPH